MGGSGHSQATVNFKAEPAKVLTYLSQKLGLKNSDVLRYVFIKYCEEHRLFEIIKQQKR